MKINQFLKFTPILKEKIWGGEKLKTQLGKKLTASNVGESWEISTVEDAVSIVENGALAGESLNNLIGLYKEELLGKSVYATFGTQFPLLIKFIDAKEALSIQVHPNDLLAKERHQSFGKTEMWYVVQADADANLIVGFKEDESPSSYLKHLEEHRLTEILNIDKVVKGDVYFIPTGRVHAIGAGVLLAEIQQTSDITYRIYDWDRKDSEGNSRELHLNAALDAIDYSSQESYKTDYLKEENTATKVISCPYFTTNFLPISQRLELDHSDLDSFVIYMCVAGKVRLAYQDCEATLQMGETILVPACIKTLSLIPEEFSELLEVYLTN
ncbi:mannose-6-phosphate isomerase [Polaribacter pacificus]|uniref:Mannose-6-phosphate isomerase n=1 Tax=Polaribacter pacificus TaxID=1775173 RepID=A0A917MFI5_9FLAO|nr:type I phosphomannose isomerase catalytic subunit [Polaribacter pacificus]GGH02974.1 mannose-6-phosphate isomerase [Polaribacter pacificus]